MKKLIFIVVALILITVAALAVWQIYVPVHEDNASVRKYENLRQFVELPVPDPLPHPSTSEPIPTNPPEFIPARFPKPRQYSDICTASGL